METRTTSDGTAEFKTTCNNGIASVYSQASEGRAQVDSTAFFQGIF